MSSPLPALRRAGCAALLVLVLPASAFELSSPAVRPGAALAPAQLHGDCGGANVSPPLAWRDLPAGTQSLAITMFDPDAPGGHGWWHWAAWNLPPSLTGLPAGAGSGRGLPAGARQALNDFDEPGYGGACPPPGDKPHRYLFVLHALRVPALELPAGSAAARAAALIEKNEIGRATLGAVYGRAR